MQTSLIENEEKIIELKKSYGGYLVVSPDSCSYGDTDEDRIREWSKEKVDTYEGISCFSESDFAKQVMKEYRATGVKWLESKHPDSVGYFFLDGKKIRWKLQANWYGDMYHMDFNCYMKDNKQFSGDEYSLEWKDDEPTGMIGNLLTETGYRSAFPNNIDTYDSVDDWIKDYLDYELNTDGAGKPKKKKAVYKLTFSDDGYKPQQQQTLIDLKGGDC